MDWAMFTFLLLLLPPAFQLWGWLSLTGSSSHVRQLVKMSDKCLWLCEMTTCKANTQRKEKLGGGSTIKFMQQSEISMLVNFSRDRRKTRVWNAKWIQCTTLQILSKLFNFCFENKCTLSQRWGFKVHPKGQIPGTSEWDASEAMQPRFCDQQSSKMFVKSHFMHDAGPWVWARII